MERTGGVGVPWGELDAFADGGESRWTRVMHTLGRVAAHKMAFIPARAEYMNNFYNNIFIGGSSLVSQ
jgi:hypothetical protein